MAYASNLALGDIGCVGVDIKQWNTLNQVPVWPEKVNVWVLKFASTKTTYSKAQLEAEARRIFKDRWFSDTYALTLYGGQDPGRAEVVSVKVFDSNQAEDVLKQYKTPPVVGAWQTSNPELTWYYAPEAYVEVRFIYRGGFKSLIWPRVDDKDEVLGYYCPKETAVGVFAVYPPQEGDVPPEEKCNLPGAWWKYPECGPIDTLKDLTKDPFSLFGKIPWWVYAIGIGAAGLYIYPFVAPVITTALGAREAAKTVGKLAKKNKRRGKRRAR